MRIAPFTPLRPPADLASEVASVPYDVVDRAGAKAVAESSTRSFMHVIRPEVDLPDDVDPYDARVYAQGRTALERFIAEGLLVRDAEPGVFIYRQIDGEHQQTGVVCTCHIDDYDQGLIKKHEHTRPAKEDDRTRHVQTLAANTGPVFLAYRDDDAVDAAVKAVTEAAPEVDFVGPGGVRHQVWKAKDPSSVVDAFGPVPAVYVADGHHRSASAARAGRERREQNPEHRGDEAYNWFLTVLFPAGGLRILPYFRLLNGVGINSPDATDDLARRLASVGTLTDVKTPGPNEPGVFDLYFGGRWRRLTLDPGGSPDDVVERLDVARLQDRVLGPMFGIQDVRTDSRVDFVGGVHGPQELARRVDAGVAELGIATRATSMDELMAVADADLVMPPKSTWFEPKLLSGLFVNELG